MAPAKSKTYIVLRSSKLSKSKPLSKQGKAVQMKCSGTTCASKYASNVYKKSRRKLKSVFLYRKGVVCRYKVTPKVKGGKVKFSAKLTSKTSVSESKKTKKSKKSKKSKKKPAKRTKAYWKKRKAPWNAATGGNVWPKYCPDYSRRSSTKKTCQSNKLTVKRKSKALTKKKNALKKAQESLAARRRQLSTSRKALAKTKTGTKARKSAKSMVKKWEGKVENKTKTVIRLKKELKKAKTAMKSAKKLKIKPEK